MNLYREVDFLKEPCVFVGVHVLRWHEHPGQPTIGFVEVELNDIPEVLALKARVAELEARVAELEEALEAIDPWRTEKGEP
jgi:hypothetical protein